MTMLDYETIDRLYPKRKCKTCKKYKPNEQMFRDKRGLVWKHCLDCRKKKAQDTAAKMLKIRQANPKPKVKDNKDNKIKKTKTTCLLYTSPSPRDS